MTVIISSACLLYIHLILDILLVILLLCLLQIILGITFKGLNGDQYFLVLLVYPQLLSILPQAPIWIKWLQNLEIQVGALYLRAVAQAVSSA